MSPMELITRANLAAGAAHRWKEQYFEDGHWKSYARVDGQGKYDRLVALGPTPDPDEVDRVIGNKSWTTPPTCGNCDSLAPVILRVGQEPDYESQTAYLCYRCALGALAAFDCTAHEDCRAHPDTLGRACTRASLLAGDPTEGT